MVSSTNREQTNKHMVSFFLSAEVLRCLSVRLLPSIQNNGSELNLVLGAQDTENYIWMAVLFYSPVKCIKSWDRSLSSIFYGSKMMDENKAHLCTTWAMCLKQGQTKSSLHFIGSTCPYEWPSFCARQVSSCSSTTITPATQERWTRTFIETLPAAAASTLWKPAWTTSTTPTATHQSKTKSLEDDWGLKSDEEAVVEEVLRSFTQVELAITKVYKYSATSKLK